MLSTHHWRTFTAETHTFWKFYLLSQSPYFAVLNTFSTVKPPPHSRTTSYDVRISCSHHISVLLVQDEIDCGHLCLHCHQSSHYMMTSSNGNIFLVTGPLCGEITGPGEFPTQRPVTRSFDVFFCVWINDWVNNREAGDLRRHRGHYDVIVMIGPSRWLPWLWMSCCHIIMQSINYPSRCFATFAIASELSYCIRLL